MLPADVDGEGKGSGNAGGLSKMMAGGGDGEAKTARISSSVVGSRSLETPASSMKNQDLLFAKTKMLDAFIGKQKRKRLVKNQAYAVSSICGIKRQSNTHPKGAGKAGARDGDVSMDIE